MGYPQPTCGRLGFLGLPCCYLLFLALLILGGQVPKPKGAHNLCVCVYSQAVGKGMERRPDDASLSGCQFHTIVGLAGVGGVDARCGWSHSQLLK